MKAELGEHSIHFVGLNNSSLQTNVLKIYTCHYVACCFQLLVYEMDDWNQEDQWEPFKEQFSHYPLGVSTCSQFKKIHVCKD